jgi:hypothetical protein
VLGDDAAANRSRIFNRHVPAVEIDHLRAQLAVSGIKRSLANNGCGFDRGQWASITDGSWAAGGKRMRLTRGLRSVQTAIFAHTQKPKP